GRTFADVVIGVPPGAAVGQGHAAADAVEAAVQRALPRSDVVVHVEPSEEEALVRERVLAAALGVPGVREVHNVNIVSLGERIEVSLHLKLPGSVSLEQAHEVANEVERAIAAAAPEVDAVQTHLEPLGEGARGLPPRVGDVERQSVAVRRIVQGATGRPPRSLRFVHTDEGVLAFLTLGLDGATDLREAHRRATEVEQRIRREEPWLADVIIHTEP
nr:hypothetical protein [Actinomycetota bacterium]